MIPIIRETITLFDTLSMIITARGTNFSSYQIQTLFSDFNIETPHDSYWYSYQYVKHYG